MRRRKVLAGLVAGLLVPTALAAVASTGAAAAGPGVYHPGDNDPIEVADYGFEAGTGIIENGGGVVTDVDVRLNDVTATRPDDLDIELVGPNGVAVVLMSDACGITDLDQVDLVFDDEAAHPLPDAVGCGAGPHRPVDHDDGTDQWPVPPTPGATLAAFDGSNPNGYWVLRVHDDQEDEGTAIEGGFVLTVTTAPYSVLLPGGGATGPAAPYPFQFVVSGKVGKVADLDLVLGEVTHQRPEDLSALLVAPNGTKALLVDGACGEDEAVGVTWTLDDEAAGQLADDGSCPSGSYRPRADDVVQPMPAPAPVGPYAGTLSRFDGIDPNGTWSLYLSDDGAGAYGFLGEDPRLVLRLTDVTAPDTVLVGKKPGNTTKKKAKIRFTSTEAGSTFRCKVDAKKYKPCTSPLRLSSLSLGRHKVLVLAADRAGNQDAKPLKVTWKVLPKD